MRNGLLICTGAGKKKNIGDYIQTLAQEQFYEKTDGYVEREHMDTFQCEEKVNVIMNAWFMWNPENFPPAQCINPLFVSFHLVPSIADRFFTDKSLQYLKKYEPIGARDYGTRDLLTRHGISSYFSGCLTLTLGLKYKSEIKTDEILFVDPYYELGWGNGFSKPVRFLSSFIYLFRYYNKVRMLDDNFVNEVVSRISKLSPRLEKMLWCASFYRSYSKVFEDDLLKNAVFIKHEVLQSEFKDDDAKLDYARFLMHKYARAKFVVTSRIHCGLPCLGVETPVIFVNSVGLEKGGFRSAGRFGGLIELFHVLNWTHDGFSSKSSILSKILEKGAINRKTTFSNFPYYKPIADNLIKIVSEWVSKNQ